MAPNLTLDSSFIGIIPSPLVPAKWSFQCCIVTFYYGNTENTKTVVNLSEIPNSNRKPMVSIRLSIFSSCM